MKQVPKAPSAHEQTQLSDNQVRKKESTMQIGMIGLGRMGANMVRRLL